MEREVARGIVAQAVVGRVQLLVELGAEPEPQRSAEEPGHVEAQIVALHTRGAEEHLGPERRLVGRDTAEPLRLDHDAAGESVVGVVAGDGKSEPVDRSCHGGGERESSEHGAPAD